MITRCCPACSKRHAQLINPNCPICEGFGTVTLGAAALSMHEPATVGLAVEIAIEAAARTIDKTLTLSDDRIAPLRAVVGTLTAAGIVDQPGVRRTTHKPRHLHLVADNVVEIATGYVPSAEQIDHTLTAAPAYQYEPGERPNARGLPILSAAGHPSHTARLTDPMTPGNSTSETARERRQQARSAAILVEAAPKVVTLKARKAAKKTAAATAHLKVA